MAETLISSPQEYALVLFKRSGLKMIAYGTPTCPITQRPAIMFCYTDNCPKPAFGCQPQQLIGHKHGISTKCHFWEAAFPTIRRIIERQLPQSDLAAMDRQDKQLLMLIEQLKGLQQSHHQQIQLCRQRQKLGVTAQKVIAAVREGNSNEVTGNDMATFIKAIENDEVFENLQVVELSVSDRNKLLDAMLDKLNNHIEEYKQQETALPRPQQIPNDGIPRAKFSVDTANSITAIIANGITTVREGNSENQPVFAQQELTIGQTCEIEIVDAAQRKFRIGVATTDLRNRADQSRNKNSICIDADGALLSNGNQQNSNFRLETGDIVLIKRSAQQVEWMRGGEVLGTLLIPTHIREAPLFPVLWINDGCNPMTKLRFK